MKILVVSNRYPPNVQGGYEVECAGAVALLRERGDDVRVLTTRSRSNADDSYVFRQLHPLPHTRLAHVRAPLATLAALRTTRALLRSFEPDLAFVWNGTQMPHSAVQEIFRWRIPTAFRICEHWFNGLFAHDFFIRYTRPDEIAAHPVWSAVIRGIDRLPFVRLGQPFAADTAISWVSDFLRTSVPVPHELRVRMERVVHPMTARAQQFENAPRRPSPRPIIAFVGRLTPEKGAHVAVDALGALSRDGIDAELVLAGTGGVEDKRRLEAAAAAAEIENRCTFVGALGGSDLAGLLSRAAVLVVPSVWEEPLPLTIAEGALARVPIVASRVGGIPEAIEEGTEALLTTPGDPGELAQAVRAVLTDPEAAAQRVSQAYARARAWSWDQYRLATEQFVDDAARTLRSAP